MLARDRNTVFGRTLDALDSLRGCRFTKGDEWEVIGAQCIEGTGFGDEPDKGGLIVWVIALTWENILETEARLEKHER
jgi:hypothetical protein